MFSALKKLVGSEPAAGREKNIPAGLQSMNQALQRRFAKGVQYNSECGRRGAGAGRGRTGKRGPRPGDAAHTGPGSAGAAPRAGDAGRPCPQVSGCAEPRPVAVRGPWRLRWGRRERARPSDPALPGDAAPGALREVCAVTPAGGVRSRCARRRPGPRRGESYITGSAPGLCHRGAREAPEE